MPGVSGQVLRDVSRCASVYRRDKEDDPQIRIHMDIYRKTQALRHRGVQPVADVTVRTAGCQCPYPDDVFRPRHVEPDRFAKMASPARRTCPAYSPMTLYRSSFQKGLTELRWNWTGSLWRTRRDVRRGCLCSGSMMLVKARTMEIHMEKLRSRKNGISVL